MNKTTTTTTATTQSAWVKETYKKLKTNKLNEYQADQSKLLLNTIQNSHSKLTALKQDITKVKGIIKTIQDSDIPSKDIILTDYTSKYQAAATEYNSIISTHNQAKEQYQEIIDSQDSATSLSNLFYAIAHDNFIPEKYLKKWNNLPHNYLTQENISKAGKIYYTINLKDTILEQYGDSQLTEDPELTLSNIYEEITNPSKYYTKDRWTSLNPALKKAFTQTVIHCAAEIIAELEKFLAKEQTDEASAPSTPASADLEQRTMLQRLHDVEPEVWELENLNK